MPRIDDGYQTVIDFDQTPVGGLTIWEKRVSPPGLQGGGANDTTTMRNLRWRTMNPKYLMTLSEMKFTSAYDPIVYDTLLDALQLNQIITVGFPDFSVLNFYGFLDDFTPGECAEGSQPEADMTVIPTNQDENGVETGPTLTPGLGHPAPNPA